MLRFFFCTALILLFNDRLATAETAFEPEFVTNGLSAMPSPDGSRLVFSRFHPEIKGAPSSKGVDDASGTFQLWMSAPNGAGARCITCHDIPGGPQLNQHKHIASWHPSGKWLIVPVEMPSHSAPHAKAHGGTGAYVDIWAFTPDATQWVQLTHYANQAKWVRFEDKPVGALIPRLSRNGKRLVWSEMIGYDKRHSFGIWRLAMADFVVKNGVPALENIQTFKPGGKGATFYEPWSFSADNQWVTVASDGKNNHPGVMDVHVWNVNDQRFIPLMKTRKNYEEQSIFSSDGRTIAYMSTSGQNPPYNPQEDFWGTFRTDIWLMNADGSNKRRLTYFNDPADASTDKPVYRAIPTAWSPDDRYLYVEVVTNRGSQQHHEEARQYRIPMTASPDQ